MDGDTYSKGFEGPQQLSEEDRKLIRALQRAELEVRELHTITHQVHSSPTNRFAAANFLLVI